MTTDECSQRTSTILSLSNIQEERTQFLSAMDLVLFAANEEYLDVNQSELFSMCQSTKTSPVLFFRIHFYL